MVTKPTPGATGWNVAVDEVIDIANSVADLPSRVAALEGAGGDVTEAELAAGLATKAAAVHNHAEFITQDNGDNRYILQTNAGTFAPAESTTTALAGKQPLDSDLTAFAGLDSATAGTVASDGAGWVKKTYAQMKTALGLDTVVVEIGVSSGTDDTATINALLAAAAAGRTVLKGTPGQTYLLTAPLVVGSNTTLDMTGCTVQLKTGSTAGIMLVNAARTAQRSVADGAMTSGSATLTSATAAFTSADVGRTVHVPGAAAFGQRLVANITAVASGTSATLSLAAGTTVSGAALAIHARDTNITLVGGTWDKQNNDGTGTGRHTIVIRHVDGLTISGASFRSTAGKYALSLGGWTNLLVEDIRFPGVQSDGIHLHGPGRSGVIRNIHGITGDDLVSLTPQDWAAYNDIQGDITDVSIEDVFPVAGGVRAVNIIASRTAAVKRIRVRNVLGSLAGTAPAVHIGDDSPGGGAEFAGGAFDNITVENVSTTVSTGIATVLIDGTAMKRVRVSGVHYDNAAVTGTAVIDVAPIAAGTIRSLTVENLTAPNLGGQPLIRVGPNATIASLTVDKADIENLTGAASNLVFVQGVVTDLMIRGAVMVAGNSALVNLDAGRAAAAVSRCSINGCRLKGINASAMIQSTNASHTLPLVEVVDAVITSMAWVADLNTTTELHLSSVSTTSPFGIFNIRAAANVTVRGAGFNLGAGSQGVQVAAGGQLRSKALDLACDVSLLTQTAGDRATNTNAALSCGVGPVLSNGSVWRAMAQAREVREYLATASGITTPTGILGAFVTCIQGGHSGGSGRRGAAGTVRGGGQGGSPAGLINEFWLPAGQWAATYSVTVGAGATGGATVSADDTNGNPGAVGGQSFVATGSVTVKATGGSAAGGGTTSGGTGGSPGAPQASAPNGGAGGTGAAGATPTDGFNVFNSGPAGGGGGISAGDVAFGGGNGRGVTPLGTAAGVGGAVGGAAPTAPALLAGMSGGGAGGGAASITAAAQAGADGLGYGSPGGGGGASLNGNASGRGGNGGPGYVRVTFVYS